MSFKNCTLVILALVFSLAQTRAEDLTRTRPEMKKQIEALKERASRLPLPAPTEEEIASGRILVNNSRLRSLYLPPSWQSFVIPGWGSPANRPKGGTQALLKAMESNPDYAFKTRLFWIVSRANDCQYCLGHQELKLRRVGMTDDQIAALDSRWDLLPANEQAAVKATRKLTLTPHLFSVEDIDELKQHFNDRNIIDILYTVSRYNAVNRWTSSTGIPQDQSFGGEEHSTLDVPTSPEFAECVSKVIPSDLAARPAWEVPDVANKAIDEARKRESVVNLPSIEFAQRLLEKDTPGVKPPSWFQAIAEIPICLDAWVQRQAMVREGKTTSDLRIRIAWVSARENRAWYAAGHARARWVANGGDSAVLGSFEDLEKSASAGDAEALRFARKLTSTPHMIEDQDIAQLRTHFTDHEVAEIIQLVCDANAFDRLTESLRLKLEF